MSMIHSTGDLSRCLLPLMCLAILPAQTMLAQPATEKAAAPVQSTMRISMDRPAGQPISRYLTGKFCEHLGTNIYNGMCAQILRNPTFADYPFWTGGQNPDGRATFLADPQRIKTEAARNAGRLNWPQPDIDRMLEDRADSLAFWWFRQGTRQSIAVSPDVGPFGGRAQRLEIRTVGDGIAQWAYLPAHRTRAYQYQITVRSPGITQLKLALATSDAPQPLASATIDGITTQWQTLSGQLQLPDSAPAGALYRLSLSTPATGQLVIARLLLWPADHIAGSDPEVIVLLKQSQLPILRWPGGNFVSGYHWEDGVGPAEKRPTTPNFGWGSVEPNLYGTDEFIAFCRAVGCEPMICVNAGDGSPEEAARWVEYCNGPANSPMGARRAANGHPQPYNIHHWELGNELWGHWQVNWTTPAGNVDRALRFAKALLAVDPTLELHACGAPVLWGRDWNLTLFRGIAGSTLRRTTDHPLIGGNVPADTDPMEVYRNFMAVPDVLEGKWKQLRKDMLSAGIKEPRLTISELQLFAHIAPARPNQPTLLRGGNLVNPGTFGEAIYDTLLYHVAVRSGGFIDMITQSATVNHGGGLRKERERVYPNPVHHAQSMFVAFAGAIPIQSELDGPSQTTKTVLGDITSAGSELTYTSLAALAAIKPDKTLLISLVHRGADQPINLTIGITGQPLSASAQATTLHVPTPWTANTLDNPAAVSPVKSTIPVTPDGKLSITLEPFSIVQLTIPGQ